MYTDEQIEASFKSLESQILGGDKKSGGTGVEDVLLYLYDNPQQIWHMSWEFVGKVTSSGKYLSHRAPARASDLANFDPQLVQDRKIGRYKAYRLRWENMNLVKKRLGITNDPGAEREEVKVKPPVEYCEHGVPTFVVCPRCEKEESIPNESFTPGSV